MLNSLAVRHPSFFSFIRLLTIGLPGIQNDMGSLGGRENGE